MRHPPNCRKPTCLKPQAADSVFCEPHRDEKRRINADGRARKAKGLPKQKPGRKPKGAAAAAVVMQAFTQRQAAHAADSPTAASIQEAIAERRQKADRLTAEITILEGALTMLQAPKASETR